VALESLGGRRYFEKVQPSLLQFANTGSRKLTRALVDPKGGQATALSVDTIHSFTKGRLSMKLTKNIGMLLLALWLVLTGLIQLLNLYFSGLGILMAILAIAAGVFISLGR
jgi:hypothetical protein